MTENRDQTVERLPMDLAPTPVLKVEPPRNSPGGALLRTVPLTTQPARFLTNIQSQVSAVPSTSVSVSKQVSGSFQRLEGGAVGVPQTSVTAMSSTAVINRLTTLPGQTGTTTGSYHVPRGAAAVANIAVPRSSIATPILRGTSTLQTIGVATPANQPGVMRAASPGVGRGGSWVGVATSQAPRHPHNTTFTQSRMAVSARIGPVTAVNTRPVLLQTTTHKQLQTATQMHVAEKKLIGKGVGVGVSSCSSGVVRPVSGGTMAVAGGPANRLALSRVAPPLRPVVSLHPSATAVLVSTPPTVQIQTTRPVSVLTSAVRMTTAPATGVAVSKVYSDAPVYIQTTHKPAQVGGGGNLVSIPNSLYSLPANSFYESNSGSFRTFTTVTSTGTSTPQPLPQRTAQGIVTTGQSMRFPPVMVVDPSAHSFLPNESGQGMQTTETCNSLSNQQPQSQPPPHLHIQSQPPPQLQLQSQPPTTTSAVKQNASPRPSILRKRDTDGTPGKAAKNLNPLFGTLTVATPSSPPSPKRPESGGNGPASSGGSTTISATSSPGLCSDSPPLPITLPLPLPQSLPHPSLSVVKVADDDRDRPLEMSPRKKPRKQQLTGNQIQEPKFSDEEMEFIPTEKLKKTSKEVNLKKHTVVLPVPGVSMSGSGGTGGSGSTRPISKRPVMSLLHGYRPTWKARHHHFQRYTDVKPREERRPSLADLAHQRNVLQKINGWKIYHLGTQMANISDLETDVFDKLTAMLKVLEKKSGKDGDINRVNELIKGNIQRSKVITDQLQEAKCQVMKLFDHKCKVTEVLNRFASRRSGKKRERT